MAWTGKSTRFPTTGANALGKTETPLHVGPGAYLGHQVHDGDHGYAPFGSTANRTSTKEEQPGYSIGPAPGAYDPKLPQKGLYESGLPKKQIPFHSSGLRVDPSMGQKNFTPGPGWYEIHKKEERKKDHLTMGEVMSSTQPLLKSTSAPSIPQKHQSYGYEESHGGRLTRSAPKDGYSWMSGRPGDNAGPGEYEIAHALVKARTAQGKFLGGIRTTGEQAAATPGPGHYIAKAERSKSVGSSFQSAVSRLNEKAEKRHKEAPGPGSYDWGRPQPTSREERADLQYFNSTTERFGQDERSATRHIGPGSYAEKTKRLAIAAKPFHAGEKRFKENLVVAPGPGQYEPGEEENSGPTGTFSILASSGQIAFGGMSKRFQSKDLREKYPGPGAYTGAEEEEQNAPRILQRKPQIPSANFKSQTSKAALVERMQKEGQQRPPPGAYNPVHPGDVASFVRLPGAAEGFGSAAPRKTTAGNVSLAPAPGKYDVSMPSGGKKDGTFNRCIIEGVPQRGKAKSLGFSSNDTRFKAQKPNTMTPGPGGYSVPDLMNKKTFNQHFGEVA